MTKGKQSVSSSIDSMEENENYPFVEKFRFLNTLQPRAIFAN